MKNRFRPVRLSRKHSQSLYNIFDKYFNAPNYQKKWDDLRIVLDAFYVHYPRLKNQRYHRNHTKKNEVSPIPYLDHGFIKDTFQTVTCSALAELYYEATSREDIRIYLKLQWGF